jgi:hypothetical protein
MAAAAIPPPPDPLRRRPYGSFFFRSRKAVKRAPYGAPPQAGSAP